MLSLIKKFRRDEEGATAVEYGLIAAGLAVAIVVAINVFGGDLAQSFADVGDGVQNAATSAEGKSISITDPT